MQDAIDTVGRRGGSWQLLGGRIRQCYQRLLPPLAEGRRRIRPRPWLPRTGMVSLRYVVVVSGIRARLCVPHGGCRRSWRGSALGASGPAMCGPTVPTLHAATTATPRTTARRHAPTGTSRRRWVQAGPLPLWGGSGPQGGPPSLAADGSLAPGLC